MSSVESGLGIPATSFPFGQKSRPIRFSPKEQKYHQKYHAISSGRNVNPSPTASILAARSEFAAKNKGLPWTSAEETRNGERLLQKIDDIIRHPTGQGSVIIDDVSLNDWLTLSESHREGLSCKLEYLGKQKSVIITHPSGVHESFHSLLATFTNCIRAAEAQGFMLEMNRDVVRDKDAVVSNLTPDLCVSRSAKSASGGNTLWYLIAFECAYSQTESDLLEKVQSYFDDRYDLLAVVCLFIRPTHPFANPTKAPRSGQQLVPMEDIDWEPRTTLGAVRFQNHIWAPGIQAIKMQIHYPNSSQKEFDLTPPYLDGPADTEVEWGAAELALCILLKRALGNDLFKQIVSDFELDREKFYSILDDRLKEDAYNRYHTWLRKTSTVVLSSIKRSASASDEDEDEMRQFVKRLKITP